MLILLPVSLMFLTALTLLILRFARPNFKYPWMLAAGGGMLALVSVLFWQTHLPSSVSLPAWQPATIFPYTLTWIADSTSWPYALALVALAVAIIWTSVVRAENDAISWVGILVLVALGTLAIAAENPLTLILAWSAIDFFELIAMLRFTEGETQSQDAVISFAMRLAGTGLVLWASMVSTAAGISLDFSLVPSTAGIYLLIAAGLRLGIFPLRISYRNDNILRRGSGTALRLVSAAASLALLARIPTSALNSPLIPYLLVLVILTALYSGWMWLRASDEIIGRPFWMSGVASIAIAYTLWGNPTGSIGWGVTLILSGGLIFLFSARRRRILWLPLLGLWALSALPFSPTAITWQTGKHLSWLFVVPLLPSQAFLMAGFFRHTLHPGETSLESQEKWVKLLYPVGLLILPISAVYLGLSGWAGAQKIGYWWLAVAVMLLAAGCILLVLKTSLRLPSSITSNRWTRLFSFGWLYNIFSAVYDFLRRIFGIITFSLEGEGGLLWSLLLLVLILSILSTRGQ